MIIYRPQVKRPYWRFAFFKVYVGTVTNVVGEVIDVYLRWEWYKISFDQETRKFVWQPLRPMPFSFTPRAEHPAFHD